MDDGHVFRREAGGPSLRLVEASVIPATGETRVLVQGASLGPAASRLLVAPPSSIVPIVDRMPATGSGDSLGPRFWWGGSSLH